MYACHLCLDSFLFDLATMEPNVRNKFKFFNDYNIYKNTEFFKLFKSIVMGYIKIIGIHN